MLDAVGDAVVVGKLANDSQRSRPGLRGHELRRFAGSVGSAIVVLVGHCESSAPRVVSMAATNIAEQGVASKPVTARRPSY